MDGIKELIESIPSLFIFFIPGYITLYVKQILGHEKDKKDSHTIIQSIIISFILKSIIDVIIYIIEVNNKKTVQLDYGVQSFILIVLSIITGIVLYKCRDSFIINRINKGMDNNINPEPSVWNYAMKSPKGAWVRVYIKELDLAYVGRLDTYTIDPDDNNKELVLTRFTSYKYSTREEIENYNDDNKMVLIKYDKLTNIEILKD